MFAMNKGLFLIGKLKFFSRVVVGSVRLHRFVRRQSVDLSLDGGICAAGSTEQHLSFHAMRMLPF